VVTSGPALSPDATRQNMGTFYQDVDMLGAGMSHGSMGLDIVQVSQTPVCTPSMLDPVNGHIPVKIKENNLGRGICRFEYFAEICKGFSLRFSP